VTARAGSARRATSRLRGYKHALAVGDFNNDGNLDLATIGDHTIVALGVLLGNGDGTFQPPVNIGIGLLSGSPLSVAAADFNTDGKMDLAVTVGNPLGGGTGGYELLSGDGAGGFAVWDSDLEFSGQLRILAVADFDADGVPDLAMTLGSSIDVLLSDGILRFSYGPAALSGNGGRRLHRRRHPGPGQRRPDGGRPAGQRGRHLRFSDPQ